jgi:hypothetical protein
VAARAAAGHHRPAEAGGFIPAMLVALVVTAATVLFALWVLGYLGAAEPAPSRQYAIQYPAEPRPTPYWPFREEWLTPRPKR